MSRDIEQVESNISELLEERVQIMINDKSVSPDLMQANYSLSQGLIWLQNCRSNKDRSKFHDFDKNRLKEKLQDIIQTL